MLGVLLMVISSGVSAPSFDGLVKTEGVIQELEWIEVARDLPRHPEGAALELMLRSQRGLAAYRIRLLPKYRGAIDSLAVGQEVTLFSDAASTDVWQVERTGEVVLTYLAFHDLHRVWHDKWLWSGAIASNIGLVSLLVSVLFWKRLPAPGEVQRE